MMLLRIENFIAHPITRVVDLAAVVTGTAYVVPGWRDTIHEWSLIAGDMAPIFAIVWMAVQILCKLVVTWEGGVDNDSDTE